MYTHFSSVKQSDPLSPLLFSLYINDLIKDIINEHCGVTAGSDNAGILLYESDIVLLSDSSDKLQQPLNCLHKWCMRWQMYMQPNQKSYTSEGSDSRAHHTYLKWIELLPCTFTCE